MSANTIVDKINEKSKEEIQYLLNEGQKQAKLLEDKILDEAKQKAEKIINSAKTKMEDYKKSEKLKATLNVRKATLAKKRQLIDDVYKLALNKLNDIDDTTLEKIIKNTILSCCMAGEVELIIAEKHYDRYMNIISKFKDELEANLTKKHKINCKLSFSKRAGDEMGLIFIGKDFDVDASFVSMLNTIKEKSEKQIAQILFESKG